ncbi:hypothetical protein [Streptomyces brevispora]|uniref:Uncharacterized protein n=1 Tax=Streptomyces brevispora TaxID=887462 RepID=A0ABZ1GC40_9ACTN|nr:hypothetical protein [Streptomyces brevispora]WSC17497.1 hypothetical protein OIE64_34910 [Streptomyces brevispora]
MASTPSPLTSFAHADDRRAAEYLRRAAARAAIAVFVVTVLVVYAASIVWPLVIGARTWMWVDVIVFPFIALIAYSTIFGDRAEDGSPNNKPIRLTRACGGGRSVHEGGRRNQQGPEPYGSGPCSGSSGDRI